MCAPSCSGSFAWERKSLELLHGACHGILDELMTVHGLPHAPSRVGRITRRGGSMLIRKWWTATSAALTTLALSAVAHAQAVDPDVSTTTTRTTTTWYGNWYVWVGLAVFLVIVIALTNRGSR